MKGISVDSFGARFSSWFGWPIVMAASLGVLIAPVMATEEPLSTSGLAQASPNTNLATEANRLLHQGIQQFENGQIQSALETFKQELALRRQLGDRVGEQQSLRWIGKTYQREGQYQEAIDFYQEGLGLARENGDRAGEGYLLADIGTAYTSLGQYSEVITYFEQSLIVSREFNYREGEAYLLRLRLNRGFKELAQQCVQ